MKKFILSILMVVFSISLMFAQNATIRLEMPATMPNMGEDFFVGVWLDVLEHPGITPDIFTGQLGVNFDPAVLTPLKTGGPPPLQRYYWNKNAMFTDYGASLLEALAAPGDYRLVINYGNVPGMDPSFYGDEPFHMFDLKYTYNTADPIIIEWGKFPSYDKINDEPIGGKLGSIESFLTASDGAAYAMTYIDFNLPCACTIWTGLVNTDWDNAGNWDVGVPTGADDAVIPVTANDPVIGGSAATLAMQIDAGVMVTIAANGGGLTTNGTLTNNGILYVDGTASGGVSGSYVDLGGMGGSGQFEFFQDVAGLTAPAADPTGWHYISSPVDGFDSDEMFDYYVNTWDETTSTWVHHSGNPSIPCGPAPNIAMNAMDAWSVKFDVLWVTQSCPGGTGAVVEFFGNTMADVHTGPYAAGATFNAGAFGGWNFFGNPYPSSIDPALIVWDANMNNSTYYWDGFANTYEVWAGGVGSVIPPTQGFFTSSTAPGTMAFTGAERINGSDWFWKSEIANLLTLEATNVNSDAHDKTYVRFMDEATVSFDKVWDAYKLMSYAPGVPQIYTTNGSDHLAINAQEAVKEIPMNFESVGSGTFNIAAIETNDMTTVILEDTHTGEFTDLMLSSYTFEHTAGVAANRFIIHFAPVGVEEMNANNVNIWSSESNIYVQAASSAKGDIVVYNIMGQEVVRTDIAPGVNVIPMDDVNTYYVVKVLTDDNAVTGKVYIK